MNAGQVDRALVAWDDAFNARHTRRVTTRSVRPLKPQSAAKADAVRQRLLGIVRRTPQVMVRISGGGKGMRHIRAHLDYITRQGRLTIEDQDGERYVSSPDVHWLGDTWQLGGQPIPEQSERREALNLMLSMPAGTDLAAVKAAVRAFAAEEFSEHQYAFVLHHYEEDPGRSPSPHPHVHLCVKMASVSGERLNPRKQDLRRWRERFAERLRAHEIDAAASSRMERFQRKRGYHQSVHYLMQRGLPVSAAGVRDEVTARRDETHAHETRMLRRYAEVARLLARAESAQDRWLEMALAEMCARTRERKRAPERSR